MKSNSIPVKVLLERRSVRPAALIVVYCVLIVLSSLAGGWLPRLVRLTHMRLQLMMSAVGGLMLGIGLFHLLPHAVGPEVPLDRAIWWLMLGLLTTFFLIRVFHAHEHGPVQEDAGLSCDAHAGESAIHTHDHSHDHAGHHEHGSGHKRVSWVGIALGLSLHTLLDGVALSASVMHDAVHSPEMFLYGFAVFLGVLLHKPLDSLSITSMMAAAGWPFRTQQFVNFGYALMCPLGAAIFAFGVRQSASQAAIVGCALAFAAGIFLCISLSDLLPELHFHSHDRLKLSASLLIGVAVAYGIGFLEPAHMHGTTESHQHSDEEHHDHENGHGHDERSKHDHGHPAHESPGD